MDDLSDKEIQRQLSQTSVNELSVNVLFSKRRSSFCWKYFGNLVCTTDNKKRIVNADQVYCLPCLNVVKEENFNNDINFGSAVIKKYNKTISTGNLTRHLQEVHNVKDTSSIISRACGCTDKPKGKRRRPRPVKTATTVTYTSTCTGSTGTSSSYSTSVLQHSGLARDIALWFCKSLLPFDSVSDVGMVDFFKKYIIVSEDEMPPRHFVSGVSLSALYESVLAKVKETICTDGAQHLAITFDSWTKLYQCSSINYITFTLHYITSDFNIKSLTLNTGKIKENETGIGIYEMILDIKKMFALDNKYIVAVTDSADNVKRAVSLANMTHHLCLGHGLHNLITVDGIKSELEIAELVMKCKKIVKTIRHRAVELYEKTEKDQILREFLGALDSVVESLESDEADPIPEVHFIVHADPLKVKVEPSPSVKSDRIPTIASTVPTRWHCILEMLESVFHVCDREPINNMLMDVGHEELSITEREWLLLEELLEFLRNFQEVLEIISSQKTCTLNVALLFRSEIYDVLNVLRDESTIMARLRENMLANFNNRFPVTKETVAAALIDNRFISLKEVDVFLDSHKMTRATFLSSYIKEVISATEILETNVVDASLSPNSGSETSVLQKLSKKHSVAYKGMQDDPTEQECWRYIVGADPTEPKNGDLLAYWNNRRRVFPRIAALAKALLCVPATRTPAERVFSRAGLKFSRKRSRLNPYRVNEILFVHDHYETCPPSTRE